MVRISSSFWLTLPAFAESAMPSWLARAPSTSTRWITKSSARAQVQANSAASAQGRTRRRIGGKSSVDRELGMAAAETEGAHTARHRQVHGVQLVGHEVGHDFVVDELD